MCAVLARERSLCLSIERFVPLLSERVLKRDIALRSHVRLTLSKTHCGNQLCHEATLVLALLRYVKVIEAFELGAEVA